MRIFGFLLRRSLVAAFNDGCFTIAKGAAYSALLSFFPVLASAAAILVQTRARFVSRALQDALYQIVPPGSEGLVVEQFRAAGRRSTALLIVADLIALWAASGVIKSLIEGFHAAYHVPRNRSFLRGNAVAMGLVLLCAAPLVGASVLIVFGAQIEQGVLHWSGGRPWQWVNHVARYLLAISAIVPMAGCLLYFGPNRPQRWRLIWPGALLASALWLLATAGFGWYVRHMADYNVMYGSVGAGIALLVWMYLLAVSALIGCEFNAAYERATSRSASA
jgi:membrane protein